MILPIEQQVPNLGLCKRLRELGFPQLETYLHWSNYLYNEEFGYDPTFMDDFQVSDLSLNELYLKDLPEKMVYFAAPTVAELIHVLGDKFGVLERFVTRSSGKGNFGCYMPRDIGANRIGDSPVEALAELWIHLREKGLV